MDSGIACMQRPRRQAAVAAMENIRRVREWEDMHENSKRFRECAAQIDAEFRAEERQHAVKAEDLATDAEDGSDAAEASEDEYMSANDSFVSDDGESEDGEYAPDKEDEEAAEAAEAAETDEEDGVEDFDEAEEEDEEEEEDDDDQEDDDDEEDEEDEAHGVECVSEQDSRLSQCETQQMHGPGDEVSGGAGDAA